jgi:hypothetical protein
MPANQAFQERYKMTDVSVVVVRQGICPTSFCSPFIMITTFFNHSLLVFQEDMLDSPQELCVLALFTGFAPSNLAQKD